MGGVYPWSRTFAALVQRRGQGRIGSVQPGAADGHYPRLQRRTSGAVPVQQGVRALGPGEARWRQAVPLRGGDSGARREEGGFRAPGYGRVLVVGGYPRYRSGGAGTEDYRVCDHDVG